MGFAVTRGILRRNVANRRLKMKQEMLSAVKGTKSGPPGGGGSSSSSGEAPSAKAGSKAAIICHNCRKPGHIARHCPNKK